MTDSQLKMSDMTTIFRRLGLKQNGLMNYIDFFNSVYGSFNLKGGPNEATRVVKEQKIKKNFITLINQEQKELQI